MLLAAWVGAALAADGMDGVILPGASPLEARASVGAYGGWAGAIFAGSASTVGGEASIGITDRVALIGFGGRLISEQPDSYHLVSVRWLAHAGEDGNFHFAPMLTNWMWHGRPLRGSLALGAAIEGGGEKARFDLSIPSIAGVVAGFRGDEYSLFPAVPGVPLAEVGITARIGDVHRIRVGIPAITWGVRTEHVYFELSGSFLLLAAGASAKLGARF